MLVRKEVEQALRVSRMTVYNMVARGELNPVKVAKRYLFCPDEIERLQRGEPAVPSVQEPATV